MQPPSEGFRYTIRVSWRQLGRAWPWAHSAVSINKCNTGKSQVSSKASRSWMQDSLIDVALYLAEVRVPCRGICVKVDHGRHAMRWSNIGIHIQLYFNRRLLWIWLAWYTSLLLRQGKEDDKHAAEAKSFAKTTMLHVMLPQCPPR